MIKHLQTRFIIADGEHARWVRRARGGGDFITTALHTAAPAATGHPMGVVFESASGRRATTTPRIDAAQKQHARFAIEVAQSINAEAARGGFDRLVIVAPAHTLQTITEHLSPLASRKLTCHLAKDLVKTPDHKLGDWLRALEFG